MDVSGQLNALLTGRYDVEREVGAGGMATVYLARDLRHDRKVALKVLRPELAAVLGPERFLSEIKVTANLQHPHLLPLFDSGEAEGHLFYVMPYVEGETLRHRLERERQLPVEEAVRIGAAVASALDYAHRHGVIHRDLKPENILLHEGEPLVTDFGIALAVSVAGGARITQTGLSLGTPQYMSPEQATGDRQIDARSDIYSLGAVVYEMLVGDPPHLAGTTQAIIAKVLTERPPSVRLYRETVPEHVDATVMRALAKLPADRFATAGEFGEALTGARPVAAPASVPYGTGQPRDATAPQPAGRPARAPSPGERRWRWAVVSALATAIIGLGVALVLLPSTPAPRVARFVLSAPPSAPVTISPTTTDLAISPDGGRVVYTSGSPPQLYVRAIDELEGTPLRGTENAINPFFSPDGNWIAYNGGGSLRKISVLGGPPVTLCAAPGFRGGSWGSDDTIVFATSEGLLRVSAAGGDPTSLLSAGNEPSPGVRYWPEILPGGRAVLLTSGVPPDQLAISLLDLETLEERPLVAGGSHPRYSPTGHIVYGVAGTLRAVPFDADRLEVTGDPVPLLEGVMTKILGAANFSIARDGSLAYVTGGPAGAQRTVAWVDREGQGTPLPGIPPDAYRDVRVSPDGSRIAVATQDDVWTYDLTRATLSRLTTHAASDRSPLWTPDGARIVFTSIRAGAPELFGRRADGTGEDERLLTRASNLVDLRASGWSPDGRSLLFTEVDPQIRVAVGQIPVEGGSEPRMLVQNEFNNDYPAVSPDGRWIAYHSNLSGRFEIYVERYPDLGDRQQISTGGGHLPIWSPTGRELFFTSLDGRQMLAVAVQSGATLVAGRPTVLFEGAYLARATGFRPYDVAPDGRFAMIKLDEAGSGSASVPTVILVQNWFEELKRLAPAR